MVVRVVELIVLVVVIPMLVVKDVVENYLCYGQLDGISLQAQTHMKSNLLSHYGSPSCRVTK